METKKEVKERMEPLLGLAGIIKKISLSHHRRAHKLGQQIYDFLKKENEISAQEIRKWGREVPD